MKYTRILTILAACSCAGSVSAAWTRLSNAEARPANLAVKSIPGTAIHSSKGIEDASALLSGGTSKDARISAGSSSVVIKLAAQQVIEDVYFVNDSAEGKVTCTASADDKNWVTLGHKVFTASDRFVSVHFAGAQAKYVNVSFETIKPGSIRSFAIYGTSTSKDFKLVPATPSSGGTTVNLASGVGGAHVIYVFPTPTNAGEFSYLSNNFKFPKTNDKYRTIVYDLGSVRTMKEFATSYSRRPVRVEVFAFEQLPEKTDWRGKLTLDPNIFNSLKPVAVGEDPHGNGHVRMVPAKPVTAQYVALRFEPNYQHASTGAAFGKALNGLFEYALGPVGALADSAGLLPTHRFAEDDDGFSVGGVEIDSNQTFNEGATGGGGSNGGGGGNNNNDNNNANNNGGSGPSIPGTPGAPAALSQNTNTGGTGGTGGSTGNGGTTVTPKISNITTTPPADNGTNP